MVIQKSVRTASPPSPTPDIINYIAGDFCPTITQIWEPAAVSEYLMASAARRHIWHAVFSARQRDTRTFSDIRKSLTERRGKDLIREAYGSCPPGMIRLLSKLGPRAESSDFYRAVHSALSRGDILTRILQHEKSIDPRMVYGIAYLPTDRITARIASFALRRGVSDIDIEELSWVGRRIADFDQSGKTLESISKSSNPITALRKAIANLPFPRAPWEAQGISPVQSAEELAAVARRMGNCLADPDQFYSSCLDVHAGLAYYFQTPGDNNLLLKFSKFGNLGWYLDECRGLRNRRPSKDEIEHITMAVSYLDEIWWRRMSYQMR